jgi:GT2 family glycosyltransferase
MIVLLRKLATACLNGMPAILPGRLGRWMRQEGMRGFRRKVRQILVYWKFRVWVFLLRPRNPAAPPGSRETPLFSIVLPAYRTEPSWLRQAVRSVRAQWYPHWELCLGLCEVDPALAREMKALSRVDARIRVFDLTENRGISGNGNFLAREARAEFLAILDHDDYLEPHALSEVAARIADGADFIYTDEDIVSPRLRIPAPPNIKPDWAPENFYSGNYICHFCCFRRDSFEAVGGYRSPYDGAQDQDLFLRLTERARRIAHVPKVLYHWRRHALSTAAGAAAGAKPYFWEAGRRSLEAHFLGREQGPEVEFGKVAGSFRLRYPISRPVRVDILIPSSNREGTLGRCLASILNRTRNVDFRVIVMLNGPRDFGDIRAAYGGNPRVRLLDYGEPFNFSRINNVAAASGDGEVLAFLNDDVEVIEDAWLEGLLEHALRPEIGAAGPMLLYPDGTIQHAGISVNPDAVAWEMHKGLPQDAAGYHARAQIVQNVTAVTGACLVTRRACFEEAGGFDETFPLAYNDIDYCLKLLAAGRRVVYTPFVRLIHHESLTRGFDLEGEARARLEREMQRMRDKWGADALKDRYFDTTLFMPGADLKRLAREYWATPHVSQGGR